jgi:enoyl-CoA hydratase
VELKNIVYSKIIQDRIARITVNRPESRNSLDDITRNELVRVIDDLEHDLDIKVVIITGAGDKSFISGADIRGLEKAKPSEPNITPASYLFSRIEILPMPVIAMINGYCLGAGNELAMACDIRICSDNAKFGQPEIKIGIIPGAGGTQRLPRLIGWGKAKELVYTGRIIDAAEALQIGLVDKVVPYARLDETVLQLATTIAEQSPLALRAAKKAFNKGMYDGLSAGLEYEERLLQSLFGTEDQKEGARAFLEKRKPNYRGM